MSDKITDDANNQHKKKPTAQINKGWLGWLKEIVFMIAIVILVGWGADYWRSQSMASGQAPTLIAESVQGNNIDLIAMSQEKPVIVYFWATWCAICNGVSPSVNFLADNTSNYYQVVTVALSSGTAQRIKHYLNAKEYSFNVINDPKGDISRAWGVSVTPTIFVIHKGEITSVTTGFTSPIGMWLRLLIA